MSVDLRVDAQSIGHPATGLVNWPPHLAADVPLFQVSDGVQRFANARSHPAAGSAVRKLPSTDGKGMKEG